MNGISLHIAVKGFVSVLMAFTCITLSYAEEEGTLLRLIITDSFDHVKRGTGFVVADYDYIITAYHVVQNAKRIDIDRPKAFVSANLDVIAIDPDTDVAFLKIPTGLRSKLVPFKLKSARSSSSASIALLGYGSVVDRQQRYTGVHENRPFVPSGDWNRPASMPGTSRQLFDIAGVNLIMFQAPTPYGLSGGPVINSADEVIGVISGALTRIENVTSIGWAIPIQNALKINSQWRSVPAANVSWPALKLITDKGTYMRAFGGAGSRLISELHCSDSIKRIETAWDVTTAAIVSFQGYLTSARVAVDIGARQASSRRAANEIMSAQVSVLKDRFAALRSDVTAYQQQIVVAANACNRDVAAIREAIEKLPRTEYNKQIQKAVDELAVQIVNDVSTKGNESAVAVEYELRKQWTKIAAIVPLSDDNSSFLSRPSKSIESDIHIFLQYVDAFDALIKSTYVGTFKDRYSELESELGSYLLWIESTNYQPWDGA